MTVQPTADHSGLSIQSYDPEDHDALVEQIRSLDGNILVVGHSNTVSRFANYFVGEDEKFEDLQEIEYDFIYEVTLENNGSKVVRRKYGEY